MPWNLPITQALLGWSMSLLGCSDSSTVVMPAREIKMSQFKGPCIWMFKNCGQQKLSEFCSPKRIVLPRRLRPLKENWHHLVTAASCICAPSWTHPAFSMLVIGSTTPSYHMPVSIGSSCMESTLWQSSSSTQSTCICYMPVVAVVSTSLDVIQLFTLSPMDA